jgi:hypothetical protein
MAYAEFVNGKVAELKEILSKIAPVSLTGAMIPIYDRQIIIIPNDDMVKRESIAMHSHTVSFIILCSIKTLKKDEEITNIIELTGAVQDEIEKHNEYIINRIVYDYRADQNFILKTGAVVISTKFETK